MKPIGISWLGLGPALLLGVATACEAAPAPTHFPTRGALEPSVIQPDVKPPQEMVDRDRIMRDLRRLPESRAINGDRTSVEGLAQAASMIQDELERLGHEVHEQEVTWSLPVRDRELAVRTSRNLWIDLPGMESPDEVLIVGAHFDAVPRSPGADDNGTGVAAALELARVLTDRPMQRTVRIMFYTAEEVGLIGSYRYAEQIAKPAIDEGRESIVGMISLDMLGYYSDEPGSQENPLGRIPGLSVVPDTGDFLAMVAVFRYHEFNTALLGAMQRAEPSLRVLSTGLIPEPLDDMKRSDHAPFWAIGVPAVLLTDTSEFRNPHYHTPHDRVDTLDPTRLTKAVRSLTGGVYELAGPARAEMPQATPELEPSEANSTSQSSAALEERVR